MCEVPANRNASSAISGSAGTMARFTASGACAGRSRALGLHWRFLLGRLLLALVMLAVVPLFGCSDGNKTMAFDGGGFPIGGGTRIYGVVVAADNPIATIGNATVAVQSTAPNGEARTILMATNAQGVFDFPSVPTGVPTSQIKLSVVPAAGTDRQGQSLEFTLTNGQAANLVVALPPSSFNPFTVQGISLTPRLSEIHGGDSIHLTARLIDASGRMLDVLPSLLFSGNFGSVGSDGNFTSTANGIGQITALFDNGNNRQFQVTGQVIANSTTPSYPPPPPSLPVTHNSQ